MRVTAILTCFLLTAGVPLANAATDAATATDGTAAKERAASMSAEQKATAQKKAANMSPEQKAAAQKKAKSNWHPMTPEQEAEARKRREAKMQESAARTGEKKAPANSPADLPPPSAGPR